MATTWKAAVALAALGLTSTAFAQNAATVIANASKNMGVEGLSSITYYGSGANYNFGQYNNANYPWPRVNVNDYRRTIDFTKPALLSTGVTFAVPVTGGPAAQAPFTQNISSTNPAWAQQLEIWVSPWGFLKGAQQYNATARRRTVDGEQLTELSLGIAGEVAGRPPLSRRRLHQPRQPRHARRHVAREPVFGDMLVVDEYSRLPRQLRPQVSGRDRAEARRLADVRRADPRRPRESGQSDGADDAAAARRPAPAARRPEARPRPRPPRLGTARERRLSHHRRLHRARRRVRRSHPDLRAGGPERGARASDHRRSEARDPEQADPLRRAVAPSLRPHERHRRRRRRRHHDRDARGERGVLRERA